jgi:hypothetical protein
LARDRKQELLETVITHYCYKRRSK